MGACERERWACEVANCASSARIESAHRRRRLVGRPPAPKPNRRPSLARIAKRQSTSNTHNHPFLHAPALRAPPRLTPSVLCQRPCARARRLLLLVRPHTTCRKKNGRGGERRVRAQEGAHGRRQQRGPLDRGDPGLRVAVQPTHHAPSARDRRVLRDAAGRRRYGEEQRRRRGEERREHALVSLSRARRLSLSVRASPPCQPWWWYDARAIPPAARDAPVWPQQAKKGPPHVFEHLIRNVGFWRRRRGRGLS